MARIPHETIQRIHDATDIVDVVSDFVSLKKRGTNYTGLCPFHNEKTPSFSVSPAKGIFKCFGCGKGGNAMNFIMELEGLSYVEALKWMADKYNIEIEEEEETEEQRAERDARESMFVVSEHAATQFAHWLYHSPEGKSVGLGYLYKRGFRDDIINKFHLGYSPDQKRAFTDHALGKGYKQKYLESTGLTINKNDYLFDRFRGRVMFPIKSLSGKTIGFGGRILKNDDKTAKYLNSPESEIYNKSRVLYGIYQAKKAITKDGKCFLVEGYTDVLAFHQAGIENVVASSGTSLTEQQIRLIKRFTENITLVFDGDEAGVRASVRGINMILKEGMRVKTILLPDGEDPDSFAKARNSSQLLEYVAEHERDFIEFKTELLMRNSENDPVKKAEAITDIVRSIAAVPNSITQSVYIQTCSRKLNVQEEVLYSELNKIKHKEQEKEYKRRKRQGNAGQAKAKPQKSAAPATKSSVEYELIKALLRYHDQEFAITNNEGEKENWNVAEFIFTEILGDELEIQQAELKLIFDEALEQYEENGALYQRHFVHHSNPRITKLAADFISTPYSISRFWESNGGIINKKELDLTIGIPSLVLSFKSQQLDDLIRDITEKLKHVKDEEEEMELLQHFTRIKQAQMQLSRQMGGRILHT